MITFVGFLFGFALMVAASTVFTFATIGTWILADNLAWRFRQGSLSREAQRELARARVRARRADYESLS